MQNKQSITRMYVLLERFIDSSLSAEEQNELADILNRSGEARSAAARFLRLEGGLVNLGKLGQIAKEQYVDSSRIHAEHGSSRRKSVYRRKRMWGIRIAAVLAITAAVALYFTVFYRSPSASGHNELEKALVLVQDFKNLRKREALSETLNRVMNRDIASGRIQPHQFISLMLAESLASVRWLDRQGGTVRFLISHTGNGDSIVSAGIVSPPGRQDREIVFDVPLPVERALRKLIKGKKPEKNTDTGTWLDGWVAYQRGDYKEAVRIFDKEAGLAEDPELSCIISFLSAVSYQRVNMYNRMEDRLNTMSGGLTGKNIPSKTTRGYAAMALFMNGITNLYERERPIRARHYLERLHKEYTDSFLTDFYRKHLAQETKKAAEEALSLQNTIPYTLKDFSSQGEWKLLKSAAPPGMVYVEQHNPDINTTGQHGPCYLTKRVIDRDFYAEWRFFPDRFSKNTDKQIVGTMSILNYEKDMLYYTSLSKSKVVYGNEHIFFRFKAIYHYISPGLGLFKSKAWIEGMPEPEYGEYVGPFKAVVRNIALGLDMKGCSGTVMNIGLKYIPFLTDKERAQYKDKKFP